MKGLGVVPGGGVEPPRAEARRILSPLRLPVPPSRLLMCNLATTSLIEHFALCNLRARHARIASSARTWDETDPQANYFVTLIGGPKLDTRDYGK